MFCKVTPTESLAPSLATGYNIMVLGPGTVSLLFNPQVLYRTARGRLLPVVTHMVMPFFEPAACFQTISSMQARVSGKPVFLFCSPARGFRADRIKVRLALLPWLSWVAVVYTIAGSSSCFSQIGVVILCLWEPESQGRVQNHTGNLVSLSQTRLNTCLPMIGINSFSSAQEPCLALSQELSGPRRAGIH